MKELHVSTSSGSYPIFIDPHFFHKQKSIIEQYTKNKRVIIIVDQYVEKLILPELINSLPSQTSFQQFSLPQGEHVKTMNTVLNIIDFLVANHFERDNTLLIAMGGGVIGDITGFTASCYLRGVQFIQVPTTLLAMVDASVGGKTAVNHLKGKNLIGSFYHPQAIFIDIDLLKTLDQRQYLAGLFEVIKYGLIYDMSFFEWFEQYLEKILLRNNDVIEYLVFKSCEIKAKIVGLDEKEQHIRTILNFGHTFAHGLETILHYQNLFHGEAVGLGMAMAAKLSYQLKMISDSTLTRIFYVLKQIGLPKLSALSIKSRDVVEIMKYDKKIKNNTLRFVLLEQIGKASICEVKDEKMVEDVIASFL